MPLNLQGLARWHVRPYLMTQLGHWPCLADSKRMSDTRWRSGAHTVTMPWLPVLATYLAPCKAAGTDDDGDAPELLPATVEELWLPSQQGAVTWNCCFCLTKQPPCV